MERALMCFFMRRIDPGERTARGLLLCGCCWERQQTHHWCVGAVMLLGNPPVVKGEGILSGEGMNSGWFVKSKVIAL